MGKTDTDLQGIKHDIHVLLIDDYESLTGKVAQLEQVSFELRVAINRLLKEIKTKSAASEKKGLSGVKLLKVSVSTIRKRFKLEELLQTI